MRRFAYQRNNILKNIEHVGGVTNVISLIAVKPRVAASNVQANIEASKISVAVVGGTVTLTGTVESLEEMERVENAAWAAPGVAKVVDNLRVAS